MNFWGVPLREIRALGPADRVKLDADSNADATVAEHLHERGQLRVTLDGPNGRQLVVAYDAIERIL